jgi:Kef-type K+ transport system membrane component KefB
LHFLSWQYLALAAFGVYVISVYVKRYVLWRKVQRLGAESPRVTTRFVFGLFAIAENILQD